MNLNMIRPKNEPEGLLVSFIKKCETLIEQTHTILQRTLEYSFTQPMETFSFKPYVNHGLDSKRNIGLTNLDA